MKPTDERVRDDNAPPDAPVPDYRPVERFWPYVDLPEQPTDEELAALSPELSEALSPLVGTYDAILMANHGVVTYGADLLNAFFRMETTEHFARVSLVTELIGKQVLLSSADVEKLLAARARYGIQTAAQVGAECPVTAEAVAADRITLTRQELEALIEEAVRHERERSRG